METCDMIQIYFRCTAKRCWHLKKIHEGNKRLIEEMQLKELRREEMKLELRLTEKEKGARERRDKCSFGHFWRTTK